MADVRQQGSAGKFASRRFNNAPEIKTFDTVISAIPHRKILIFCYASHCKSGVSLRCYIDCKSITLSIHMLLSPTRKAYKGVLQLRGGSIKNHGKDSCKYPTIGIGSHELHDIVVSHYFEKLLVQGNEIELTLSCASFTAFMLAVVGGVLVFTAEISDIDELLITGVVVASVSTLYWFSSLINAGHEIYSIKINNTLYRNNAGVQYEDAAPLHVVQHQTAPATSNMSDGLAYQVPVSQAGDIPNNGGDSSSGIESGADEQPGLSPVFNSHIHGVSRLICPQCAIEALVMPETNIICGNCRVWMQVDHS